MSSKNSSTTKYGNANLNAVLASKGSTGAPPPGAVQSRLQLNGMLVLKVKRGDSKLLWGCNPICVFALWTCF
jgi:hypothetical protein